jgi:hypothetical protein
LVNFWSANFSLVAMTNSRNVWYMSVSFKNHGSGK